MQRTDLVNVFVDHSYISTIGALFEVKYLLSE